MVQPVFLVIHFREIFQALLKVPLLNALRSRHLAFIFWDSILKGLKALALILIPKAFKITFWSGLRRLLMCSSDLPGISLVLLLGTY